MPLRELFCDMKLMNSWLIWLVFPFRSCRGLCEWRVRCLGCFALRNVVRHSPGHRRIVHHLISSLQMCWRCWFSVSSSCPRTKCGTEGRLFAASRTVFIPECATVDDQGRVVRSLDALWPLTLCICDCKIFIHHGHLFWTSPALGQLYSPSTAVRLCKADDGQYL